LDKISLDEVKPSSRKNPFIQFTQDKKLHRTALEIENLGKTFAGETKDNEVFKGFNLMAEVGERIAIIGPNGIGKTTLLRCLFGDIEPTAGDVKWSENSDLGYYAQDHAADFEKDNTLIDWMGEWGQEKDDEQVIRGTLGRLLFSQDDIDKSVKVLSGGEQGRMLFGKLMLQKNNILLLDEPTNHMDMESIESLNLALENYPGTLIFVSHDREFVSSLATRVLDLTDDGIVDFRGPYEDYVASQDVGKSKKRA
ncbi:Bis-ABC ATPase YbiT, partial [hydrothermal vent metagenome]